MSRSRNIKPGFFKNELLVGLPFEFRLLFIGLWTIADREGRFEDRPTRIRMELFPADNVDVNAGLQSLHDLGFILRYEVNGSRYCQVLAWEKHQSPHFKEQKSTIPAPGKPQASNLYDEAKAPVLPEASLNVAALIPDSLIPDSKKPQEHVPQAARFADFWSVYPIKRAKKAAESKWKQKRLDAKADELIADVKRRVRDDQQWRDGFAPHAATYLHQERWTDELAGRKRPSVPSTPSPSSHLPAALERMTPEEREARRKAGEENIKKIEAMLPAMRVNA